MDQKTISGITLLLIAVGLSGSAAQDSLSSASPDREPIWTARLFIIAVNDGERENAGELFPPDSVVEIEGQQMQADEIDTWLDDELFSPKVRFHVQNERIEGKEVEIELLWKEGDGQQMRSLRFFQGEQGLIEKLTVE